jgi:hypothetical protein
MLLSQQIPRGDGDLHHASFTEIPTSFLEHILSEWRQRSALEK